MKSLSIAFVAGVTFGAGAVVALAIVLATQIERDL